jgi:hypothetical protein
MRKRARGEVPHGVHPDLWARRRVYVDQAIRELQSLIYILDNSDNFLGIDLDRLVEDRVARLEDVLAKEDADASVRWSPAGRGDRVSDDPTYSDSLDMDLNMVRNTLLHIRHDWSGLTWRIEPPQFGQAAADGPSGVGRTEQFDRDAFAAAAAAMRRRLWVHLRPVTPGQLVRLRVAYDGLVAHRGEVLEGDPDADRNKFVYEERRKGTSNPEIIRLVKSIPGWTPLNRPASVRKAADKHADDNGLERVDRRKPGRK